MQRISPLYPISPFEKLFIEKGVELLYRNTLDSYRLRLHNPKSLIEELITICQSSLSGILTNNDYAKATTQELKKILDCNYGLSFSSISLKHFLSILNKTDKNNYRLIIQASKLVLKDNTNYIDSLFIEIYRLIYTYNKLNNDGSQAYKDKYKTLQKSIITLTNHLFVELINKGYSKQYLHNFFQTTFIRSLIPHQSFKKNYRIFKSLANRPSEEFTVIFNIIGNNFQYTEFKKIENKYKKVDKKFRKSISPNVSSQINNFLEKNKESNLIYIKINAQDYLKAIEISLNKLSKDIDIYHLGFNDHQFNIDNQCAVIGTLNPLKSSTFPTNFQIDGYIRSNSEIFEMLLSKLDKIKDNSIHKDSYDKILSAIRYYRTGSESPELETKLLNYWIGLEYIFTSHLSEEKTIDRIKKYFPKCHSLIYVKRNLYDFHKSVDRLGVATSVPAFNQDLSYLLLHNSYNEIITNTNSELLKFRTEYLQKWREEPNKIQEVLINHQNNLEWNIIRLYRIRNEIVHNAAIKNGIYTHISHMKYYLTFILNSILDFMADVNVDLDNDGKVTIDDYFISQEIILGSLKDNKLTEYLKIKNPTQILH